MKLRNRKTGEIATLTLSTNGEDMIIMGNDMYAHITKLSELKDYEDCEEPKEYWYIENNGDIDKEIYDGDNYEERMIEIGNYFDTLEEAEKAVEKLKCFTNLKNHEFMFDGWYYGTDGNIVILANAHEFNDMEEQDLTKVFGEKNVRRMERY